jgi:hypothetical protein
LCRCQSPSAVLRFWGAIMLSYHAGMAAGKIQQRDVISTAYADFLK